MGLVKSILCKVCHFIKNMVGYFCGYTIIHTARYIFLLIAIDKVFTFFFHNRGFLFRHGTAYQIASSIAVTCKVTNNLHNLLLIYNTTICRRFRFILSLNVFWYKVHWSRTIQRNTCNNIFQTFRFKLLHKAFHASTF